MRGVKVFVVGVDGTPASQRAVCWTAELARAVQARVVAVHVVPRILDWELAVVQVDSERIIRDRQKQLSGQWTVSLAASGATYSTRFLRGDPAKMLLQVADTEDADLIVIGAHPHGRMHEALLGGTVHEMANRAHRPVALIPALLDG